MKNKAVVSHKQRIDHVFEIARGHHGDVKLQGHLACHLCVSVSGFIEVSVQELIAEYVRRKAAPAVASFVSHRLERFTNATAAKIVELLGEFDEGLGGIYERTISGKMKDSLDGVVNVRHQIAHGRNTGITLVVMENYYKDVVRAVEELERLFDQT